MPEEPGKDQRNEAESPGGEKHVDRGWKEEAKREKERLAAQSEQDAETARRRTPLPKPSFELMVSNLAIQAFIAMGAITNPITRKQEIDLEQAKHTIDLLGILEEKTRGNLSDAEKSYLEGTLYDLRMRYVSMASQQ